MRCHWDWRARRLKLLLGASGKQALPGVSPCLGQVEITIPLQRRCSSAPTCSTAIALTFLASPLPFFLYLIVPATFRPSTVPAGSIIIFALPQLV